MRAKAARTRLGHVAVAAGGPQRLAGFYSDVLDLEVVRQTSDRQVGAAVPLGGEPAEEGHELVLLTEATRIAFRVDSRQELRMVYCRAKQHGLGVACALDSGVAIGFLGRDPEGNALEVYLRAHDPRGEQPPLSNPDEIDRLILGTRWPCG